MTVGLSHSIGLKAGVYLHGRIGQAMNIRTGDFVEFEIIEAAECFISKVNVFDDVSADVLVHGTVPLVGHRHGWRR